MVKKARFKKYKNRQNSRPLAVGACIFALLEAIGGSRERSRLESLWQNWDKALGPDLAALADPGGYRGKTLILGVQDALDMQEISLRSEEILEKVNGFLETGYFDRVKAVVKGLERLPGPKRRPGAPDGPTNNQPPEL